MNFGHKSLYMKKLFPKMSTKWILLFLESLWIFLPVIQKRYTRGRDYTSGWFNFFPYSSLQPWYNDENKCVSLEAKTLRTSSYLSKLDFTDVTEQHPSELPPEDAQTEILLCCIDFWHVFKMLYFLSRIFDICIFPKWLRNAAVIFSHRPYTLNLLLMANVLL